MSKATARYIEQPEGMGHDDDPRRIGDQIVIPASNRRFIGATASSDCGTCYGRGMYDVTITVDGESERVSRPCSCIYRASSALERMGAIEPPQVLGGLQQAESHEQRLRRRVERLQAEVDAEEEFIADAERRREAARAPYIAQAADLARQCEETTESIRTATDCLAKLHADCTAAREALRDAQETVREISGWIVTQGAYLDSLQAKAAPYQEQIAKAEEQARLAYNRTGTRHDLQVAQKRLDKTQARLLQAQTDLQQVLQPAYAEAAPSTYQEQGMRAMPIAEG
jgi:hypothetical protein